MLKQYIMMLFPIMVFGQVERWVYRYESAYSDEGASSVSVGEDKSVYAIGRVSLNGTETDFTIIKLDSSGNFKHIYTYPQTYSHDFGTDILIGEDGNVYAVGAIFYQAMALSVDTQLNLRWTQEIGDWGAGRILKGEDDKIYMLATQGGWEAENIQVVKMSYSGNINWIYTYANTDAEIGYDMIRGSDGNLYIAGKDGYNNNTNNYFLIFSVSSNGNFRWAHYENGLNNNAWAYSIAYGDNNVYATGYVDDGQNGGRSNLYVIALDTLGNKLWDYRYNGQASRNDIGRAITYGLDGNLYVTGREQIDVSNNKILVISLNKNGNERWIYHYSTQGVFDGGYSILYAPNHRIYVCGVSKLNSNDVVVICLDTLGNEQWVYRYDGPGQGNDSPAYSFLCKNNYFYIPAQSYDSLTGADFTIICIEDTTFVNKEEKLDELKIKFMVYPSIFKDVLNIKFEIFPNFQGILQIYDVYGKLIKEWNLETIKEGYLIWRGTDKIGHKIPNGIYFIFFETGNYKITKKVVLVK
jgi:hypothetical protein